MVSESTALTPTVHQTLFPLDGRVSVDGVREALGMICWQQASSVFDRALEILHEMTSAKNKSNRQLFSNVTITDWKD
jgi:hypothetical protein